VTASSVATASDLRAMKLFEAFRHGGLEFTSEAERDKALGAEIGDHREDSSSAVLLTV
jgi:hypothetical protein